MPIFILPSHLPSPEKWIVIGMLAIASLCSVLMLRKTFSDARLLRIGTSTPASVISSEERTRSVTKSSGSGSSKREWKTTETYYLTRLDFMDSEGRVSSFQKEYQSRPEIGSSISVTYNPENPAENAPSDSLKPLSFNLLIVGCLFAVFGLFQWGIVSFISKNKVPSSFSIDETEKINSGRLDTPSN